MKKLIKEPKVTVDVKHGAIRFNIPLIKALDITINDYFDVYSNDKNVVIRRAFGGYLPVKKCGGVKLIACKEIVDTVFSKVGQKPEVVVKSCDEMELIAP